MRFEINGDLCSVMIFYVIKSSVTFPMYNLSCYWRSELNQCELTTRRLHHWGDHQWVVSIRVLFYFCIPLVAMCVEFS